MRSAGTPPSDRALATVAPRFCSAAVSSREPPCRGRRGPPLGWEIRGERRRRAPARPASCGPRWSAGWPRQAPQGDDDPAIVTGRLKAPHRRELGQELVGPPEARINRRGASRRRECSQALRPGAHGGLDGRGPRLGRQALLEVVERHFARTPARGSSGPNIGWRRRAAWRRARASAPTRVAPASRAASAGPAETRGTASLMTLMRTSRSSAWAATRLCSPSLWAKACSAVRSATRARFAVSVAYAIRPKTSACW